MKTQKILILGSTGSIGQQTLDIVRSQPDRLSVYAITGRSSWKLLADQINEFRPAYAAISDSSHYHDLKSAVSHEDTKILAGDEAILELSGHPEVDTVVNSLVGFSGFQPTVRALSFHKKVALANKESLVVGGELLKPYLNGNYDRLIPIDSEHSAILQCLTGERPEDIAELIITASGGPFRTWTRQQLESVTVKDALNHPNWDMGSKITVDSATMMNKGLELIEAHWLFGLPIDHITAVVHPQSIIHSMVLFHDGSMKAQLGLPDMRLPIQYALSYPERWKLSSKTIDWSVVREFNFEPVDTERFPCYGLAVEAICDGGYAPAVLNASNEIAVERFLKEEIPYIRISEIVANCLSQIRPTDSLTLDSLKAVDHEARLKAQAL